MRCPECQYELTDNEKLLCMIPGGHYCPQCWARIASEPVAGEPGKGDGASGRRNKNDKSETHK